MFESWYADIGKKIKSLAVWSFIVEAIGGIITGLVLAISEGIFLFLFICIGAPIVAFVGSWILYGYGEIIEKINEIEYNTRKEKVKKQSNTQKTNNTHNANSPQSARSKVKSITQLSNDDISKYSDDDYIDVFCPYCDAELSFTKEQLTSLSELTCPICDETLNFNIKKASQ